MPSSVQKLERLVWPLMAGKMNAPIPGWAKPEPLFWETLTGATPGVRERSWVKLRPLRR
jgi:hypothetical protein